MKKERKVLLERLAHIQEKLKQEVKNDLVADSITTIAQIANINLKIEEECD